MSAQVLYLEDLDNHKCMTEGCQAIHKELVVKAKCHPNKGVDVLFVQGHLVVTCHQCSNFVVKLAIARRPIQ